MMNRDYLSDLAAYIVIHSNGEEPLQISAKISRNLHMPSIIAEDFFTMVSAAKTFGVPEELRKEIDERVKKIEFYDVITRILK